MGYLDGFSLILFEIISWNVLSDLHDDLYIYILTREKLLRSSSIERPLHISFLFVDKYLT